MIERFSKSLKEGEPELAPGALRLRISGFVEQNIVSLDDVLSAIDALPAYHLSGLQEICYAAGSLATHLCGLYPHHLAWLPKAEFIQRQRKIVFYDISDYELFHHVLYHEIGHFVFYLVISSQVKKRWVTQIHPGSTCVTNYARTNASEDFAETYAHYLRMPEALQRIPQKYAFMRDWVFSGRRETLKEKNQILA